MISWKVISINNVLQSVSPGPGQAAVETPIWVITLAAVAGTVQSGSLVYRASSAPTFKVGALLTTAMPA